MSLVELGWRRLNFFDKSAVLDQNSGERFDGLKEVQMCTWATSSDSTCVYIGESTGALFALTNMLKETYWKAFQCTLSHVSVVGRFVLTVGEDERDVNSLLKVWDRVEAGSLEEVDALPPLRREVRLCPLLGPAGITVRATVATGHSNLRILAAGYADGSVMAYCGDWLKTKTLNKWVRIRESTPLEAEVTGLAIAAVSATSALPEAAFVIFVLTVKSLQSFVIDARGTVLNKLKHDAAGASRECWTFSEEANEFVVATRDMVYFYKADDLCSDMDGTARGKCHALGRGHEKQQIASIGEHLAVLTKQTALIPTSTQEWMTVVTVYDVRGQYVAFTCSLPAVANVFVLNNQFIILSHDHVLSSLTQKHLNAKLDILYKKNFYDVAISVARRSEGGEAVLPLICAKYGDYLYGKGDFDNAITQYKDAIGVLQPSYVIKKFIEGSKVHHLCSYLEALHAKEAANLHHTIILVNCYARLGSREKIHRLMESLERAVGGRKEELHSVVRTLRDAKLSSEALVLAMRTGLHCAALAIIVEEMQRHDDAIKYISKLSTEQAVHELERYGKSLRAAQPEDTLALVGTLLGDKGATMDSGRLLQVLMGGEADGGIEVVEQLMRQNGCTQLADTMVELRLREYRNGKPFEVEEKLLPHVTKENEDAVLRKAEEFMCAPAIEALLRRRVASQAVPDYSTLHAFYIKRGRLAEAVTLAVQQRNDDLWMSTLHGVSKAVEAVDDETMEEMLEGLKSSSTVHPLVVLELLSRSSRLKVSAVKKFVVEWLTEQQKQIEEDRKAIATAEARVNEATKQIESLHFNPQVLQVAKCCACGNALQLPSLFFLCRHAFHVHCFEAYAERADACPVCKKKGIPTPATEADVNLTTRTAYADFASTMNRASDCNAVISKYLRGGLFDCGHQPAKIPTNRGTTHRSSPASSTPSSGFSTPRGGGSKRGGVMNPFEDDDDTGRSRTKSTNPFDEDD